MSRIDPVSGADAVRARVPAVLAAYAETRATVLEAGIVDRSLKERSTAGTCARIAWLSGRGVPWRAACSR